MFLSIQIQVEKMLATREGGGRGLRRDFEFQPTLGREAKIANFSRSKF